ncbi:sulfur carrier protein ThiS [Cohnella sp.]|uniref:sulfur carrier protein ThiS n=1 Tax=Cohnella sp. TaxID=1883426 RepID=UPI00356342CD
MELIVNGVSKQLDVRTLHELIAHYELLGKPIVAEVDGLILRNDQWTETVMRPGMRIELVHFVGGG